MSSLDPDLVQRFSGQRRVLSEEAALAELQPVAIALQRAERNHREMTTRLRRAARSHDSVVWRLRIAEAPAAMHLQPWVFVLLVSTVIALLLGVCSALILGFSLPLVMTLTFLPYAAAIPMLWWVFPNDRAPLRQQRDYWDVQRTVLGRDCRATAAAIEAVRPSFLAAKRVYDGVVYAKQFPLQRLLSADCRTMSGGDFENYLADIFRLLGYVVQQTGKSGDQGVDLIVERAGVRVAVQAKCYSNSVGNYAVQEVFTGMAIYRCNRCAVITSSVFTSGAREAAIHTGCVLIPGEQIPSLIRGRISL